MICILKVLFPHLACDEDLGVPLILLLFLVGSVCRCTCSNEQSNLDVHCSASDQPTKLPQQQGPNMWHSP